MHSDYREEILRPIVVPFIHFDHLMFQHDNAQPHVARICKQLLEAIVYSPDMSPIEHVWDALDRRVRQRVPVPANIQQLRTAIKEEWDNIPANSLINSGKGALEWLDVLYHSAIRFATNAPHRATSLQFILLCKLVISVYPSQDPLVDAYF